MSESDLFILIALAAVAAFLLFRLRNVLGERTGFENPDRYRRREEGASGDRGNDGVVVPMPNRANDQEDTDIFAYTEIDTELGQGLKAVKNAEPGFDVRQFMDGAKGAYEMLLTAYESGDKATLKNFLATDVFEAFEEAIDARNAQKLSVDMRFIGFRSAEPIEAKVTEDNHAEVSVRFVAEITTVTRNAHGEVVEGDPAAVRRNSDVWTFGRQLGQPDPNWLLTATGG